MAVDLISIYGSDGPHPDGHTNDMAIALQNAIESEIPQCLHENSPFAITTDMLNARMLIGDRIVIRWNNVVQYWVFTQEYGKEIHRFGPTTSFLSVAKCLKDILRRELST